MRKLLFLLLLSTAVFTGKACDICGCSISNNNPFLFPYLSKNYFSLNYIHRVYLTGAGTAEAAYQHFNTYQLTAQYSISEKLKVSATLPFQYNEMHSGSDKVLSKGIGDATLMLNYRLWDKISKGKRQTVLIGGGVKLPTGKYIIPEEKETALQNFQLGSGSTDYLLSAAYRLSFEKWIFSASGTYKYNTQNKAGFRFGDVLTAGATAVYKKAFEKFTLTPYVQLIHETQMKDADNHILQSHSGGNILYNGAGIDITSKKTTVGINYQYAMNQMLADGEIRVKPKLTAHISFAL